MSCCKWLSRYPNDVLIETGTGGGGGVQYALKYGFKDIHSIEIDPKLYNYCVKIFSKNKNVHLYLGDSSVILPNILNKMNCKMTFLLDAHIMHLNEIHGADICPVLNELRLIVNHSKRCGVKHSILIDDARFFNGTAAAFAYIKIDDIKKTILDIDPSYVIGFERRMIVAK